MTTTRRPPPTPKPLSPREVRDALAANATDFVSVGNLAARLGVSAQAVTAALNRLCFAPIFFGGRRAVPRSAVARLEAAIAGRKQ